MADATSLAYDEPMKFRVENRSAFEFYFEDGCTFTLRADAPLTIAVEAPGAYFEVQCPHGHVMTIGDKGDI